MVYAIKCCRDIQQCECKQQPREDHSSLSLELFLFYVPARCWTGRNPRSLQGWDGDRTSHSQGILSCSRKGEIRYWVVLREFAGIKQQLNIKDKLYVEARCFFWKKEWIISCEVSLTYFFFLDKMERDKDNGESHWRLSCTSVVQKSWTGNTDLLVKEPSFLKCHIEWR